MLQSAPALESASDSSIPLSEMGLKVPIEVPPPLEVVEVSPAVAAAEVPEAPEEPALVSQLIPVVHVVAPAVVPTGSVPESELEPQPQNTITSAMRRMWTAYHGVVPRPAKSGYRAGHADGSMAGCLVLRAALADAPQVLVAWVLSH